MSVMMREMMPDDVTSDVTDLMDGGHHDRRSAADVWKKVSGRLVTQRDKEVISRAHVL